MRQPPGPIFVSAPFFRSGRRTSVFPPPDVCRTRTPDRLAPGAAPCRVRVFPFPERIRPSALLTGCSAAILSDCPAVRLFAHLPRSTPRYDRQAPYSDRPNRNRALFGPIRPTAKRTAPSPNRIRPLRATARSVRCVSAVSRVILRSLPASEREGALRRIPPPHRGGRQPILTARPRNTGCTARPPIHGPRFTDLAGHRIRNTHPGTHEVRGGAVPCGSVDANRPTQERGRPVRKRRREPTDARTCRYSSDARSSMHAPRCTDLAGHRIRNTHPGTHEVRGAVPCGSVDANRPTQEPVGIAPMHGSRYTRLDARTSRGIESGTRIPAHTKSGEGRPSRAEASTRTDRRMHGPRGAPNPEHASRHTRSPGRGGRPVRSVDANRPTQEPAGIAPMHGPRCTDLGASNPEHASRHARSPGGAVPCGSVDANRPTQAPDFESR